MYTTFLIMIPLSVYLDACKRSVIVLTKEDWELWRSVQRETYQNKNTSNKE